MCFGPIIFRSSDNWWWHNESTWCVVMHTWMTFKGKILEPGKVMKFKFSSELSFRKAFKFSRSCQYLKYTFLMLPCLDVHLCCISAAKKVSNMSNSWWKIIEKFCLKTVNNRKNISKAFWQYWFLFETFMNRHAAVESKYLFQPLLFILFDSTHLVKNKWKIKI